MSDPIEKALTNALNKYTEKTRIYVDDPDDVPDQYEVQEGSRGGYYYETDGGSSDDSDGDDDVEDRELPSSDVEVEQEVNRVMDEHDVDPDAIGDKVFTEMNPETVEAGEPEQEFINEYWDQMQEAITEEFGEENWEVFEDEVDYQAGELADLYAPSVEQFWEPNDVEPEPF